MKKLVSLAVAGIALAPALLSTSAFATSPGALAGGSNLYKVRNTTTNSVYSSVTSATCGQTVKVSIELSNTDYSTISNITVKAPLSGDITVSGTNSANETTTSNGKVSVTVDKGALTYNAGSTQLLDINGKAIRTLDDSITTSGTNAGALAGSTREFVQYTATVKCDTPVTPTTPTTPTTPETTTPVTELASTGAGDVILPAVGLAGLAAAAVYAVRARRATRA